MALNRIEDQSLKAKAFYDRNFFAFRAAFSAAGSPDANFSAPTFLPFVGQPYLGGKTLFQTLQDERLNKRTALKVKIRMVFMGFPFRYNEFTKEILFEKGRITVRR
ncbi:MAG: hypothetical protein B7Z54_07055 [Sphingobacteriales bacterium 12-47-4]|nr:MAG: hypothetical protein B7Z54_07055 [Sphingobacteriales bacterium 12-47-4]